MKSSLTTMQAIQIFMKNFAWYVVYISITSDQTLTQPGPPYLGDRPVPVGNNDFLFSDYEARQRDPTACFRRYCRLPTCFCAGHESPRGLDPSKIPQIVMFTFDDAVNEQNFDHYTKLFPEERVNPNGCPVTATFFVSNNWTDYSMVKKLYDRGHEISSHSITHR